MLTPVPTKRWTRACPDPTSRHAATTVVRQDALTEEYTFGPPSSRIAEALRHTTLRAHEAIKREARDPRVLRDLQFEIASLELEAERLGLRGLRPFLNSLRLRVEAAI
jgi:hypothetical protein